MATRRPKKRSDDTPGLFDLGFHDQVVKALQSDGCVLCKQQRPDLSPRIKKNAPEGSGNPDDYVLVCGPCLEKEKREQELWQRQALIDQWRQMARTDRWAAYNGYLLSAPWKAKRVKVLERDQHRCRSCGKPATDVHHRTYIRIFDERLEDLVALCKACHDKADEADKASRGRERAIESFAEKRFGSNWFEEDQERVDEAYDKWSERKDDGY